MSADFDWHRDECVVVRDQPGIAVFVNVHGYIAIRQRGDLDPRTLEADDAVVVVARENAADLARAILALAEPEGSPQLALPAPADKTGADRQRRYRDRKRDGVTVTGRDDRDVTDDERNGDTVTERDGGRTAVTPPQAHNGLGRR